MSFVCWVLKNDFLVVPPSGSNTEVTVLQMRALFANEDSPHQLENGF